MKKRLILLGAALVLASCGGERAADRAGSTNRAPQTTVRADPAFCQALERIAAAEPAAFDPLRGGTIAPNVWAASVVPKGLASCGVVGRERFKAEYVCVAQSVPSRGALTQLDPEFERTVAQIDACLVPGGRFSRGPVMSFAGGERLAVWRQPSTSPAPGFTLKIEEDLATGSYTLRLGAETFR